MPILKIVASQNYGYLNKDDNCWGSILGSLYSGKVPNFLVRINYVELISNSSCRICAEQLQCLLSLLTLRP